jgi:hypothetical protein
MILLLVIAAWILVLSVVAALCATARVGDLTQLAHASAPAGRGDAGANARQPRERVEISARANLRPVRTAESAASLRRSEGVAA